MKKGDYVSVHAMESILGETLEGRLGDAGKIIQPSRGISDDYIGDFRLFQTFYRDSLLSPYKYAGLCKYGEKINRHPRKARKIFLVSQLKASKNFSQEFNERFAAALAKKYIFDKGDMPIVPSHIGNTFIGILSGLLAAGCYNRFHDVKLPEWPKI